MFFLMGKLHINKGEKMFINLFIYSNHEEEAKKIVNELLQSERQYIKEIEYKRFEPY